MSRKGTGNSREQNGLKSGVLNSTQRRSDGNGDAGGVAEHDVLGNDEVAERAYQIFEREGRIDGRDMDHWLQAERELRLEVQGREMSPSEAPRSARQLR